MELMEIRRRLISSIRNIVINLYNRDTDTVNAFWRVNSPIGELVTNRRDYRASDFIKVEPETVYTVNYNASSLAYAAGLVFWQDDSGNNPISGVSLYLQTQNANYYTFTTPTNCEFLTISTAPNSSNVQLEIGSTPSPYVPYKP